MSFLTRVQQTIQTAVTSVEQTARNAAYSTQEAIDSFSNAIATPRGESYFNASSYRYFASATWVRDASNGQRIAGAALATTVVAGVAAGGYLLAEGAGLAAGALKAGGVALSVATRLALGAATALGLAHCGGPDENGNTVIEIPDASTPINQEAWCEGVRRLTVGPSTNGDAGASGIVSRFAGIDADLTRNLPSRMSVIGAAPLDVTNSQYAYLLVQNNSYGTERQEATDMPTYVMVYERDAMGQYQAVRIHGNLPLGNARNAIPLGYTNPESITYITAEQFRMAQLTSPTLTSQNDIVIRFGDDERHVTIIPYGSTRVAGNTDACAYFGQSIAAPDASVSMDAHVNDATARPDAASDAAMDRNSVDRTDARSSDAPEGGRDGGRDGGSDARTDASADVPRG